MEIASHIADLKALRGKATGSVGLVPTMGCLHDGHLALVRRARGENEAVVVSIFVNPTQFGAGEDFATYPRDSERDITLLKGEGVDIVFTPPVEEMYPAGFCSGVEVGQVTEQLEGASRPGHFRGVATIVAKLFNIVEPTRAYFGQKDAQQSVVIERMVADLNMNLEIVIVPTVREPDGLAMSSRNTHLNPEERRAALVLWQALSLAQQLFSQNERQAESIHRQMSALIQEEPLASLDYVSVADAASLEELATIEGPALVSLAVRIGSTRLIDNIVLGD
jgi:pantoate--beta-alanine ligase